ELTSGERNARERQKRAQQKRRRIEERSLAHTRASSKTRARIHSAKVQPFFPEERPQRPWPPLGSPSLARLARMNQLCGEPNRSPAVQKSARRRAPSRGRARQLPLQSPGAHPSRRRVHGRRARRKAGFAAPARNRAPGPRGGPLRLPRRPQARRRPRGFWVRSSGPRDRKSTRLNSSHVKISYAVFCLKKKRNYNKL